MDKIAIRLTLTEMMWGALVGVTRHVEAITQDRPDNHGLDPEDGRGLGHHIEGACGELSVAKWKGCYFGGLVNSFKGPDLGKRVQVRTRSRHDYELYVRPEEADDHAFILVTGGAPSFLLRGWMWGGEAKRDEWLQRYGGRDPAYFVPHEAMRPMKRAEPKREAA